MPGLTRIPLPLVYSYVFFFIDLMLRCLLRQYGMHPTYHKHKPVQSQSTMNGRQTLIETHLNSVLENARETLHEEIRKRIPAARKGYLDPANPEFVSHGDQIFRDFDVAAKSTIKVGLAKVKDEMSLSITKMIDARIEKRLQSKSNCPST